MLPSSTFGRGLLGWGWGCSEAADRLCLPGGRKGAQNECQDWGLTAHGFFGGGGAGVPAPRWASIRAITPGAKGSRNRLRKLGVSKQAPPHLRSAPSSGVQERDPRLSCSHTSSSGCTVPGTQQALSKHSLNKSLEEKVQPAAQRTEG